MGVFKKENGQRCKKMDLSQVHNFEPLKSNSRA